MSTAPLTTYDELTIVKLLATKNSPGFTAELMTTTTKGRSRG